MATRVATDLTGFGEGRVTVITRRRGWAPLDFRELWDYRELLYFLVWRDVKIRYKQTTIGAAWVILQPLLTAAIFTIVFGHFAHLRTDGPPYALLTYTALLPWLLFANALASSTKSIVENQACVRNGTVYCTSRYRTFSAESHSVTAIAVTIAPSTQNGRVRSCTRTGMP